MDTAGTTSDNSSLDLIVLDGGLGRELERQGAPFRQPEWSALALYEAPDAVRTVHASFIAAGADYITTNTYATVPFHIGRERYATDGKRLLQLAVQLARQARQNDITRAAGREVQILGSIPPICGSYEPHSFTADVAEPVVNDFLDVFLEKDGVDALLLETVGSLQEACSYMKCIQQRNQQRSLPIWISFCLGTEEGFDKKPKLLSGETVSDAVDLVFQQFAPQQPVEAILFNCSDMRLVTPALQEARQAMTAQMIQKTNFAGAIRLGAYPNAFSIPPPNAANHSLRTVDYNITPTVFKSRAEQWINEDGATILGGCCGVSPEHIQRVSELKRHQKTTTSIDKDKR